MLTFAYADAMESKKDYPEVHSTFTKFLAAYAKLLEELEKKDPQANGAKAEPGSSQGTTSSFGSQSSGNKPPKTSELQDARKVYGVAYVMYMRFARRAEGLQALRKVFAKARKDRWAPWEVYEASAMMEFHCFDDKHVASRIFEKGLESFGEEIDYVCRYLGFLISINDANSESNEQGWYGGSPVSDAFVFRRPGPIRTRDTDLPRRVRTTIVGTLGTVRIPIW